MSLWHKNKIFVGTPLCTSYFLWHRFWLNNPVNLFKLFYPNNHFVYFPTNKNWAPRTQHRSRIQQLTNRNFAINSIKNSCIPPFRSKHALRMLTRWLLSAVKTISFPAVFTHLKAFLQTECMKFGNPYLLLETNLSSSSICDWIMKRDLNKK
jgi:hypothetical protein